MINSLVNIVKKECLISFSGRQWLRMKRSIKEDMHNQLNDVVKTNSFLKSEIEMLKYKILQKDEEIKSKGHDRDILLEIYYMGLIDGEGNLANQNNNNDISQILIKFKAIMI